MGFSFNLLSILNLLGAAQALLLALALVSIKRGNRTANRLLAAISITISILVSYTVLTSNHYLFRFPHLSRVNHPFDFLGAPLLFLYIRALVSRKPQFKKRDLLHFIPFAACALYLTPYYLKSTEYKYNSLISTSQQQWYYIRSPLVILQFLIYFIFMVSTLLSYSRKVKGQNSPAQKAVLLQVRFLVVSFITLWVIGIMRYAFDLSYPLYMEQTNLILPLGATLIVYGLAYLGLKQPEALTGMEEPPLAKKYEKSTLTPERSEEYLKRLLSMMDTEKPYTDGDLTLHKLARKLLISPHHLSQMLNERLSQNFFDFINSYRIEEAKRRLVDPARKHYSILGIAEEVGFNSKSAFNVAFKKHANMTPSEFRKTASLRP